MSFNDRKMLNCFPERQKKTFKISALKTFPTPQRPTFSDFCVHSVGAVLVWEEKIQIDVLGNSQSFLNMMFFLWVCVS